MKTKKDIFNMTKKESEAFLAKATKAEIAKHHAAGRPTAHGDEKGVYLLFPDKHKEYIKLYSKEKDDKAVLKAVGCER